MTRHRWSDKTVICANKSERECQNNCGIVKVTRHEFEGGREDALSRIMARDRIEGSGKPARTGSAKAVAYDARNYPL